MEKEEKEKERKKEEEEKRERWKEIEKEEEVRWEQGVVEEQDEKGKETTSSPIASVKLERVAKKAQEEHRKVKVGLLKIKVKAQGVKVLVEEKKETKSRQRK